MFAATSSALTAAENWNGKQKVINGAAATVQDSPSESNPTFSCKALLLQ
jgi:hypothetical protein